MKSGFVPNLWGYCVRLTNKRHAQSSRALSLRAIIWRRQKRQGIARPVPSALHLDFFAAAKPLLLGTARGEVTLLFVTGQMKILRYLIYL
jgi:hypothetical protein